MALPTITFEDFKGLFKISKAQLLAEQLEAFIDEKYLPFVASIIGVPASIQVKNETPLKQKWLDLFDGVDYFNSDADEMATHRGLKRVTVGIVYFYWIRESGIYNTPTGQVQNVNGNSTNMGGYTMAQDRYNTVILEMEGQIYPFIRNYSELNQSVTSSIDLGANNYTLLVSDTTYLYNGDTITINGKSYTVSNVVADTSFDIEADTTGLDFSDTRAKYEPFKDFLIPEQYASW
jgi:hypothetical protein